MNFIKFSIKSALIISSIFGFSSSLQAVACNTTFPTGPYLKSCGNNSDNMEPCEVIVSMKTCNMGCWCNGINNTWWSILMDYENCKEETVVNNYGTISCTMKNGEKNVARRIKKLEKR